MESKERLLTYAHPFSFGAVGEVSDWVDSTDAFDFHLFIDEWYDVDAAAIFSQCGESSRHVPVLARRLYRQSFPSNYFFFQPLTTDIPCKIGIFSIGPSHYFFLYSNSAVLS